MSFNQLHLHTSFSALDGVGTSKQYAELAASMGHKALGISDHGKLSGVFEHHKSCKKIGIKPIIGVEAYVADELVTLNEKGKRERTKSYHINLIAKNKIGYRSLLKLNYISIADEEHFYYYNRVTLEEIFQNKEGLIITTGCFNSPINVRIREGKIQEAYDIFINILQNFKEDFYGEVQLNEFSSKNSEEGKQDICNNYIIKWCKENNVKIIVTGDVHYANPGEDQVQTLSIAIRNKQTINNLTFEIESKNLYYHDIKDYIKFNEDYKYNYSKDDILEWCNNTNEIADKCNEDIFEERDRIYIPRITGDDEKELVKSSFEGLTKILKLSNIKEIPKEYSDRLKRELEVINRKGFASYILLLKEIIEETRKAGHLVSVGRGSAAGSLVCYANGVTTIDPIRFNLLFERFMSEDRSPDYVCNYFAN